MTLFGFPPHWKRSVTDVIRSWLWIMILFLCLSPDGNVFFFSACGWGCYQEVNLPCWWWLYFHLTFFFLRDNVSSQLLRNIARGWTLFRCIRDSQGLVDVAKRNAPGLVTSIWWPCAFLANFANSNWEVPGLVACPTWLMVILFFEIYWVIHGCWMNLMESCPAYFFFSPKCQAAEGSSDNNCWVIAPRGCPGYVERNKGLLSLIFFF